MTGRPYYVYLMASYSGTLYVGVTNDLARRVYEHKHRLTDGFTARYQVDRLVYYEVALAVQSAIEREKEIKRWRREKKLKLVQASNPEWRDLADEWLDPSEVTGRPG